MTGDRWTIMDSKEAFANILHYRCSKYDHINCIIGLTGSLIARRMMADQKDKELEQERKQLQSELDYELDKSKDIDEKKPFDWLIHMMKSFLLTFQLMFLPKDDTKEEDKKGRFEKEDTTVEEETTTELSDSKMLKGLGAQPKPSPPKPVPVIPINPLDMDPDEEDKDEEEEQMDQNDKFATPFDMNPLSTKLQRKK